MTITATNDARTATRREPESYELSMVPGYPMRDALIRYTHLEIATLMRFRSEWWLDLAQAHLALAENGCRDGITDAQEALAQSQMWLPQSKADLAEMAE